MLHGDDLAPMAEAPPKPGVLAAPNAGLDAWPKLLDPKAGAAAS